MKTGVAMTEAANSSGSARNNSGTGRSRNGSVPSVPAGCRSAKAPGGTPPATGNSAREPYGLNWVASNGWPAACISVPAARWAVGTSERMVVRTTSGWREERCTRSTGAAANCGLAGPSCGSTAPVAVSWPTGPACEWCSPLAKYGCTICSRLAWSAWRGFWPARRGWSRGSGCGSRLAWKPCWRCGRAWPARCGRATRQPVGCFVPRCSCGQAVGRRFQG